MPAHSLSHLRFPVACSRGRRYPEPTHPYRNAFQRDRDRIVHARAFRRLENKTQVFTAGLSDHFRNRLTHTIEVAQIARTVASALGLDEDFTEALALAHDIGHPPFAHAGEEELDSRMRRFGDRFDHNLHALRIVESFEQRYAAFPGLNLTFELREGIVKHSRDLVPGEDAALEEYLPGLRPPLEAQIIDLADEIAYNTADLDDAFSAEMCTIEEISAASPQFAATFHRIAAQFPHAGEHIRFYEAVRQMIDYLASALIEGTRREAAKAAVRDAGEIREFPSRLAAFPPDAQSTNAELKRFLHRRVYDSPALVSERGRAQRMIGDLFELFVAEPGRLPAPYAAHAHGQPVHRVACDYIAGMTDGFLMRTHSQLLGNL